MHHEMRGYETGKGDYRTDIEHMQELLKFFEDCSRKCHDYASQAVIPNCNTLFTDLSNFCDAQIKSIQECLQHCQQMERSGRIEEYVRVHEQVMKAA